MPPPTSPVVAGWELALRLRERRTELGIDVGTITQRLNVSRNYWSMVENERKILSEENLAEVVELLEFDEEDRAELFTLRIRAKERGWWTKYPRLFDAEVLRMLGLEFGAQEIHDYENLLIPGLLQTENYARAIMTPAMTVRKVEVEQRVQVRMRRQERLHGDSPFKFNAMISEAALRQQIGGPAVQREQLEHLAMLLETRRDNISIRVIPFTATSCGLFGAPTLHLLDFDNPWLPTLAWHETVTASSIIDDRTQVHNITETYHDAAREALSEDDTVEFIRSCIPA
ncbi:Scr1 family TA system antitoxin-like transcriptional regulator [Amycolatopsis sp. NPDC049688]|uniref:Scr1 family TA system antitoxin-like transcriptional regulator n=1 Tax=Amycolatopsis sp. NPDC049688 TaxID=3154733 RepID=UPI00341C7A68